MNKGKAHATKRERTGGQILQKTQRGWPWVWWPGTLGRGGGKTGQLRVTSVQGKCRRLWGSMAVGLGTRRVFEPQAQLSPVRVHIWILFWGSEHTRPWEKPTVPLPRSLEGKLWPSCVRPRSEGSCRFTTTSSAAGAKTLSRDCWDKPWQEWWAWG